MPRVQARPRQNLQKGSPGVSEKTWKRKIRNRARGSCEQPALEPGGRASGLGRRLLIFHAPSDPQTCNHASFDLRLARAKGVQGGRFPPAPLAVLKNGFEAAGLAEGRRPTKPVFQVIRKTNVT